MAETNGKKLKVRNNFHVHDDLALFILSKLPLKSLKRFGCVRKSWSLLFQNPHFMNMLRTHFSSWNSSDHGGGDTFLFLQEPELPVTHEYRYHGAFYLLPNERFEDRIKFDLPPPFQNDDSNAYVLSSVSVNGVSVKIGREGEYIASELYYGIRLQPNSESFLQALMSLNHLIGTLFFIFMDLVMIVLEKTIR
jgi:hypothetical protein